MNVLDALIIRIVSSKNNNLITNSYNNKGDYMNFFKELYEDAKNIKEKDPASRNILEVIILYPGFHILVFHRISHFLYKHKLHFLARLNSRASEDFLQE